MLYSSAVTTALCARVAAVTITKKQVKLFRHVLCGRALLLSDRYGRHRVLQCVCFVFT